MSLVWINGELVDKSVARISPFDHGFLYGDGAWEHFRAFNGKLFRQRDALNQLLASCKSRDICIPMTRDEVQSAIEATLVANNRKEGYIRVIVTRGPGTLGPDPRKLDPQIIIIAEEYQPFPIELYEHGLHATIAPGVFDFTRLSDYANTLGPINLVIAKQAAIRSGCLEAIIHDKSDPIRGIEGLLFRVIGGKIVPIPCGSHDVVGDVVLEIAKDEGIPFELNVGQWLATNKSHELRICDELFLAGTSCGVIGIVQVDGQPIGSGKEGPITRRIREAYRKLTRGEE